jgi:hypothetical protein
MFTRQNVLDAYGASRIDEEAEARDCTAGQIILDLAQRLGLNGQFTLTKVAQYQQGRQLLDRATLILSEPVKPGTPAATLAREGLALATGEIIEVAGPKEGTVRYVGLTG